MLSLLFQWHVKLNSQKISELFLDEMASSSANDNNVDKML